MVVLVVAGVTASFGPAFFGSSEERTVWSAAEALSRRDFGKAESLAASVPETSPLFPVAAVIAGESCAALHEHDQAIRYFRKATEGPSEVAIAAHAGLGERYLMIGDLGRAEEHFLKVIDRNPYHFLANKRLSHLFQVQGRSLESIPYALRMIQMGLFGATEIHIAGCAENRFLEDNRLLALCQDNFPDDYRPRLANARLLQLKNQTNEARAAYLEIVERHADVIEPYARLARISLDQGDVSRFLEINQHLPDSADQNATTWVNRGIWALQHQ
ncbi:MAG: hypothetical protein KDA80_21930, partial [Planctomycetaceae bacterium]|nr:hypothetical protein [Planctomycetaceae bacterium]